MGKTRASRLLHKCHENVTICVRKLVVADCCLVSISVATGVSLVNIRLLPFSTSDDIKFCIFTIVSYKLNQVFLKRFRDPIRVPRISNRVPRIRENYHRVPKIGENRVPRIREIGSLQIHTGYLTFSKKTWAKCFYLLSFLENLTACWYFSRSSHCFHVRCRRVTMLWALCIVID